MVRKFLIGIVVLLLLAGIGFLAIYILVDRTSWEQVSKADSPDGKFTLFEYNYFSDGNRHAPYGSYLFIKPSNSNKKPMNSYVIFAGYCSNDNLYKWASNTAIGIRCTASEKDTVKTLSKKAYGIHISAVIEHVKDA